MNSSTDTVLNSRILSLREKLNSPKLSPANKSILGKLLAALEGKLVNSGSVSVSGNNSVIPYIFRKVTESAPPFSELSPLVTNDEIQLNSQQLLAVDWATQRKSFVLTGAAGTGKTTSLKSIISAIITLSWMTPIVCKDHKYLVDGTPGIVVISYTNKAVQNVKKRLPHELHRNCMTAHKLLEYQPVYFEVEDDKGNQTKTMRYEPRRNSENPLPSSIRTLVIDEATMLDVPLWNKLMDSLPQRSDPDLQIILMGDIQQLPPVFGKSVFIHAMQRKMPVIELTEVHRQALENPILSLLHRILSGKVIPAPQLPEWNIDKSLDGLGKLTIRPWKKKLTDLAAAAFMHSFLPKLIDAGELDPEQDAILTPFNVNFGTELMNRVIATHMAKKLSAPVWEIYTGQKKVYLRVGERVLHNKSEAIVLEIKKNLQYFGKSPRPPSPTMDYEGREHDVVVTRRNILGEGEEDEVSAEDTIDFVDRFLDSMGGNTTDGDNPAKRAASHIVIVQSCDTGDQTTMSSAGELNSLLLGYAITVHKSQGSEYRRVYFITHHSQAIMFQREILYVGCSRAKEELIVMCPPEFFVKGITSQKLPGKNVMEKIDAFERALRVDMRRGVGNLDQVPNGLERFIIN